MKNEELVLDHVPNAKAYARSFVAKCQIDKRGWIDWCVAMDAEVIHDAPWPPGKVPNWR